MANKFDVIVIGSGSGSKLVRPVADMGLKVALIEKDKTGGTCLNRSLLSSMFKNDEVVAKYVKPCAKRGCIPSKMLIHAADVATSILDAPRHGFNIGQLPPITDQKALVEHVCNEIDADSFSIKEAYDAHPNVTRFEGVASFVGARRVAVSNAHRTPPKEQTIISAERIFIATGCYAKIPPILGLVGTPFMTYRELLRAKTTPESMIVIGGGYIAVELGYYAARAGNTRTTFIVRDKMLRGEDECVRAHFQSEFSRQFDVRAGWAPTRVSYTASTDERGVFTVDIEHVHTRQTDTVVAAALLVATGVEPDTVALDLATSGINTDKRGFIKVDSRFQTDCPGVYAFGDCIGRYLFKHAANFEGEWLFRTLFKEGQYPRFLRRWTASDGGVVYPPIPHAVFTYPQIAGVGLTEADARAKYGNDIVIGRCNIADVAMGAAIRATPESGFVKLVFRAQDGLLEGAHVIGEQAAVMVHMLIAFMQMKATVEDIVETVFVHPALVEVVRDAARVAYNKFAAVGGQKS
ncbi:hypothetical protein HDU82_007306 [Entophlyctis luteolus]|nr:hypothetical protein HDU82_007306 [Entophlyctis luteolus]